MFANKKKKKKHALNPIIITGFIVIGLLLIILSIANVNLSDNLKTSAPTTCTSKTLVTNSDTKYGTAQSNIGALDAKAKAVSDAKNNLRSWWTDTGRQKTLQEARNSTALDCSYNQPQCEKNPLTEISHQATEKCEAEQTSSPGTTPVTAKANCHYILTLKTDCQKIPTTAPAPPDNPQCYDGGAPPECTPAKAVWTVSSVGIGEYTSNTGEGTETLIYNAKTSAVANAQAGLENACAEPNTLTNVMLNSCQNAQKKGFCGSGCLEIVNSSEYKPPVNILSPKTCKFSSLIFTETTAKYKATCFGECNFENKCIKDDSPTDPDPIPVLPGDPTTPENPAPNTDVTSCTPSGICTPPATGTIQATTTSTITGTVTGNPPSEQQIATKRAELMAAAKSSATAKIDVACRNKLISGGTYVNPDPMTIACSIGKGCSSTCVPDGRPSYKQPPSNILCEASSVGTITDNYLATINATANCTATCTYNQACKLQDDSFPLPDLSPTDTSTPQNPPN